MEETKANSQVVEMEDVYKSNLDQPERSSPEPAEISQHR